MCIDPSAVLSPESLEQSADLEVAVVNIVATEVATFHDVFGFLGVPMIIMFVVSAAWTFMLAAIQVHADTIANAIMGTTEFDDGEFWLLPKPETSLVVASVVMLALFGIGYTALAVTILIFYRAGAPKDDDLSLESLNGSVKVAESLDVATPEVAMKQNGRKNLVYRIIKWVRELPTDIREHYFTAALDMPKLVFQTLTLYTYLQKRFPTPIIYYYSVLLLCNWLVACYRSQRYVADPDLIIARLYYTFDLFFAVFAPFVISSFCNAFHYLQFSSGSSLFYKSALNLLSLYKWRKIIKTLIHNNHERQIERKRKALIKPVPRESRSGSITAAITKRLSETLTKPKFGKHLAPKLLLSLVFLAAGISTFVYSIGSVVSTTDLCSKYEKCVLASYQWNFGEKHCTCLAFADRQMSPKNYAEWTNPEDTTSKLAALAMAGELRIVQVINRAVPELPEELKACRYLEQMILAYTKTQHLPEWMSEFSHLKYLHVEGDYTDRRLSSVADGIFDTMSHLTFLHLGVHPTLEKLPSFSSLKNLRYLGIAVMDLLIEIPSFEGLSELGDVIVAHVPRATRLSSLES
ncbi:hypothetical protein PF001_g24200 [Phytophthora fragariae]|uniref:Uncharacterized protein n=1 Tax=Phytophthora fragariae TaxID=53985 RepID=A0A6A4BXW7_9STRA|nr:hypothetical protein PF001_g24200 [Phytophthora fragariae]